MAIAVGYSTSVSKAGRPSGVEVVPPDPTAVVITPFVFSSRILPDQLSVTYTFPWASVATPSGFPRAARVPGPPSPESECGETPAITVFGLTLWIVNGPERYVRIALG